MGYPIPNQKHPLKLSQYADDTNFFVVTEDSIMQILNFFKKYQIATGATINFAKTKILTLANAKLYNLDQKIKNMQITKPNEFLKYLVSISQLIYKKLLPLTRNAVPQFWKNNYNNYLEDISS